MRPIAVPAPLPNTFMEEPKDPGNLKDLPRFAASSGHTHHRRQRRFPPVVWKVLILVSIYFFYLAIVLPVENNPSRKEYSPDVLSHCKSLTVKPSPPPDFHSRTSSDRFQPGTKPTFVTNARVWTGDKDGKEVLECMDILVDMGLIKWMGDCGSSGKLVRQYGNNIALLNAKGAWVTPG